jgi:hypothetical protein
MSQKLKSITIGGQKFEIEQNSEIDLAGKADLVDGKVPSEQLPEPEGPKVLNLSITPDDFTDILIAGTDYGYQLTENQIAEYDVINVQAEGEDFEQFEEYILVLPEFQKHITINFGIKSYSNACTIGVWGIKAEGAGVALHGSNFWNGYYFINGEGNYKIISQGGTNSLIRIEYDGFINAFGTFIYDGEI